MKNRPNTWRFYIEKCLEKYGQSCADLIHVAPSMEILDKEHDWSGEPYSWQYGDPFTAWTTERVLFPVKFMKTIYVTSVPRNPCNEATEHVQ